MNENWYPTPQEIADKIKYMVDWENTKSILDPSAGKGDLLLGIACSDFNDYITYQHREEEPNAIVKQKEMEVGLFAIEIDPSLRSVLYNYRLFAHRNAQEYEEIWVIGNDFFDYDGQYKIDCIVMNPPFDQGAAHLLRAIELMKEGGQIICVLNKETIDNPFSEERKLLVKKLKDAEIINIGKAFSKAYRKASPECVIVNLDIKKNKENFFSFSEYSTVNNYTIDTEPNKFVISRDSIKAEVDRHKVEIEQYKKVLNEIHKLRGLGGVAFSEVEDYSTDFNQYIKASTKRAWKKLLSYPRFTKLMSSKIKKEFMQQINSSSLIEFTEQNIYQFLDALIFSFESIMNESILSTFDLLTSYDKQNKIEKEGWWTNDSYKVNKKVIIPQLWGYCFSSYKIDWKLEDVLNDLDRVMMWLSGDRLKDKNNPTDDTEFRNQYENGIIETFVKNSEKGNVFNYVHESHFFRFRVYKKHTVYGTIHLEFKDEFLWQEFNERAAEGKNWIPDDYKARRKEKMKKGFLLEYKE